MGEAIVYPLIGKKPKKDARILEFEISLNLQSSFPRVIAQYRDETKVHGEVMTLEDLLIKNRTSVLDKWFRIVLEAYPPNSRAFLKKQRNRFANPVGRTIFEGMEGLFEELLHGADPAKISNFLDNIMKIRAVQDLSPSKAMGFIPHLKILVREVLGDQIGQSGMFENLLAFESRVDDMTLLAFESYMKCREKLYEIKANELRRRTAGLLKKMNLFDDSAASTWGSGDTDQKNSS